MIAEKEKRLREILRGIGSAALAFSGGVDSTLLLKVASEELGGNFAAFTAASETYPEYQLKEAVRLAHLFGVRHEVIATSELSVRGFAENPPERCYYCKRELFRKIRERADELGLGVILDGSNADDSSDFRPGKRAQREFSVRSPLAEAGFSKGDVRELSRMLALPTSEKPSFACLASRFPYGERITAEKLRMVGKGEEILRSLGLKQFRLRHHNSIARIEVEPGEIEKLAAASMRKRLVSGLKALGYRYVTVDLEGYRTGSMNETLSREVKSSLGD